MEDKDGAAVQMNLCSLQAPAEIASAKKKKKKKISQVHTFKFIPISFFSACFKAEHYL